MSFTIDYRLTGTGWSTCQVAYGEAKCEISASYLTDALGNLLLCAFGALSGFSIASFGFDEEPGEFRWVVRAIGPNEVSIQILSFNDLWSLAPDTEGEVLFFITCKPLEFAVAAMAAAEAVLSEHGLEGYRSRWVEPFPERQLELLREKVAYLQK